MISYKTMSKMKPKRFEEVNVSRPDSSFGANISQSYESVVFSFFSELFDACNDRNDERIKSVLKEKIIPFDQEINFHFLISSNILTQLAEMLSCESIVVASAAFTAISRIIYDCPKIAIEFFFNPQIQLQDFMLFLFSKINGTDSDIEEELVYTFSITLQNICEFPEFATEIYQKGFLPHIIEYMNDCLRSPNALADHYSNEIEKNFTICCGQFLRYVPDLTEDNSGLILNMFVRIIRDASQFEHLVIPVCCSLDLLISDSPQFVLYLLDSKFKLNLYKEVADMLSECEFQQSMIDLTSAFDFLTDALYYDFDYIEKIAEFINGANIFSYLNEAINWMNMEKYDSQPCAIFRCLNNLMLVNHRIPEDIEFEDVLKVLSSVFDDCRRKLKKEAMNFLTTYITFLDVEGIKAMFSEDFVAELFGTADGCDDSTHDEITDMLERILSKIGKFEFGDGKANTLINFIMPNCLASMVEAGNDPGNKAQALLASYYPEFVNNNI